MRICLVQSRIYSSTSETCHNKAQLCRTLTMNLLSVRNDFIFLHSNVEYNRVYLDMIHLASITRLPMLYLAYLCFFKLFINNSPHL